MISHGSLLPLSTGSSATVAIEFDALRYCRGVDGACLPSTAPVVWDATRRIRSETADGLEPLGRSGEPGSSRTPETDALVAEQPFPTALPLVVRRERLVWANGTLAAM
jgi:hypothetical protein